MKRGGFILQCSILIVLAVGIYIALRSTEANAETSKFRYQIVNAGVARDFYLLNTETGAIWEYNWPSTSRKLGYVDAKGDLVILNLNRTPS